MPEKQSNFFIRALRGGFARVHALLSDDAWLALATIIVVGVLVLR